MTAVAAQRLRQSAPATVSITTTDQYGLPADVDGGGAVTVTITNSAGTALATAAATTAAGSGVYTYDLAASDLATLDELSLVWHDVDNDVDWYSSARVVGGFLFTIAEARAYDAVLADDVKYPNGLLASRRDEVEAEAEWICDRSFVPAYRLVICDGKGTPDLALPVNDVRTIRSVTVYDEIGGTGTAFTAAQLAKTFSPAQGVLRRTDGDVFPFGQALIHVGVEYGLDGPPRDMPAAAITRLRSRLLAPRTGLPERARSMTDPQGNSYALSEPDPYSTGIDSVDSTYGRYSLRRRQGRDGSPEAGGHLPVSTTLSYDPQWYGIFRGGPR